MAEEFGFRKKMYLLASMKGLRAEGWQEAT